MEQEKTKLLAQTIQLKRLISSVASGQTDIESLTEHQLVKRIKTEHHSVEGNSCDSSDEGIHIHPSPKIDLDNVEEVRNELIQVRKALDRERKLRMQLEDQVKSLETQLYPERVKEIAQSVQVRLARGGLGSECGYSDEEEGIMDEEGAAAVASLVDDEGVIAETIEIEANSCPGSPSGMMQPTTIVIQAQGSSGSYSTPVHFTTATSQGSSAPRIIKLETVKAGGKRKSCGKTPQPAAIALPIDMPFIGSTSATSGTMSAPGTVTVQIINGNNNESNSVNVSNTSRHNLETIVEAIRHLEGDHFMKDDPDGAAVTVDYGGEEIVETETVELDTSSSMDAKPIKVLQVSAEQLGAIRSQVIKCQTAASRPGVIVSKSEK